MLFKSGLFKPFLLAMLVHRITQTRLRLVPEPSCPEVRPSTAPENFHSLERSRQKRSPASNAGELTAAASPAVEPSPLGSFSYVFSYCFARSVIVHVDHVLPCSAAVVVALTLSLGMIRRRLARACTWNSVQLVLPLQSVRY